MTFAGSRCQGPESTAASLISLLDQQKGERFFQSEPRFVTMFVTMAAQISLVRHFLAALAYRFHKAVVDSPDGFPLMEFGSGIRTPLEIVHHINGVLGYGRAVVETGKIDYRYYHSRLEWQKELDLVYATLERIDQWLASWRTSATSNYELTWRGPTRHSHMRASPLGLDCEHF